MRQGPLPLGRAYASAGPCRRWLSPRAWALALLGFVLAGNLSMAVGDAAPLRSGLISTKDADGGNFRYNPDPNALVVGNTLYVFTSHDSLQGNSNWLGMNAYLLYTTQDVTTDGSWQNHGVILDPAVDFADQVFQGKKFYAPGAIYKDGFFYLFFPFYDRRVGIHSPRLGIAKSATPTVRSSWALHSLPNFAVFDPALMIDQYGDNIGKMLVYGNQHRHGFSKPMLVGVMNNDVTDLESPLENVGDNSVEATFAFQRQVPGVGWKTYIQTRRLIKGKARDSTVNYVTDNPLRVTKNSARIVTPPITSAPAHTSIVFFQNRWLLFYHCAIRGYFGTNKFRRSSCMDEISFGADGSIIPLKAFSCKCKGVVPGVVRRG